MMVKNPITNWKDLIGKKHWRLYKRWANHNNNNYWNIFRTEGSKRKATKSISTRGIYGGVIAKDCAVYKDESTSVDMNNNTKDCIAPGSLKISDRPLKSFKVSSHIAYFSLVEFPLELLVAKWATLPSRLNTWRV